MIELLLFVVWLSCGMIGSVLIFDFGDKQITGEHLSLMVIVGALCGLAILIVGLLMRKTTLFKSNK